MIPADRFELSDGGEVSLEAEGFWHPRSARSSRRVFTRYADLTHLAQSDRLVWIGARWGLFMLPLRRFRRSDDPDTLLRALLERTAAQPGGAARVARMQQVEALGRRPVSRTATLVLGAACLLGYALEIWVRPEVFTVGYFSRALVAGGDWWRVFTANLLHGFDLHLLVNLMGLWVLGRHVERALGAARTVCVMGASGLAAMGASGWMLDGGVVGVSGVVFGLAGAMAWLEVACATWLPAWWRLPRHFLGLLGAAFAADMVLGFSLPMVAGEAHLGGAVGGVAAAAALTWRPPLVPAGAWVRTLAAAVAGATVLAVGSATLAVTAPSDYLLAHAARLVRLPDVPPTDLNNLAWEMAIDPESSREHFEVALALAERAVAETEAGEPTLLDTLAEVQFQLGHADRAVVTIDRAIERDPEERYYREQRRRFTGERAVDDRPADPGLPRLPRPAAPAAPAPPPASGGDALTV